MLRDSVRRHVPPTQDAAAEDTARQRNLSPDAQLTAASGRRSSSSSTSSSSSSDSESTLNTESVSESTSATPRNIALLMPPKPPESTVMSALPAPTSSSAVFPMFTSLPAAQKAGLLRPEPRHVHQTVRRRPSSLDNPGAALERAVTSSSALLSGDHDSRLTAWQRVQASMRPAHSDPLISSQQKASAYSVRHVSTSSQSSEAKTAVLRVPEQTNAPSVSGRPTSLELRKPAAPAQQRLRQVVRDPSANPSPPVAVVQPSTSNVAIIKADNGDRRRRQRTEHVGTDVYRIQSVSASAQSQRTRHTEESTSRRAQTHRGSSSGGKDRSKTTTLTSSRRTGLGTFSIRLSSI